MRPILINFAIMSCLLVWAWFSDLGKAVAVGAAAGLYRVR